MKLIMLLDKIKPRRLFLLNLIFAIISIKFYIDVTALKRQIDSSYCISEKPFPNDQTPNVNIVDLNRNLESNEIYEEIRCKQSSLYDVRISLCVHDLSKDIFVSRSIWQTGLWERTQLELFIKHLHFNPDCLVIDIGAQIGIYSLFAAKMGHNVITVEPFYDNILRIQKAASLENTTSQITLIQNAISNKRNEIKQLEMNSINIGGQGLLTYEEKKFDRDQLKQSNKYLVETILFDDIVSYLPKRSTNKAILKIDIEGYEPYAFQYSKNLFRELEIEIILMEWGKFGQKTNHLVREMLNFLFAQKLRPFNLEKGNQLLRENCKEWPWDIVWKKMN